ncbi:PAS domain S-box protein [Piscinibacter sakaiensis]|uniref:PAS domain S-box protein n=1 Tax=Piscinibacter sakaiensis TaxID=1547922 RepID=UPI003AB055F5
MSLGARQPAKLDPALLRAIEEATRAGLAAVDASGRQSYVNPEFCRMLGFDATELLGCRAPFPYWPADQIGQIQQAFERTIRGEAPCEGFPLQFQRKDGSRVDVRLLISPLLAVGDEPGWLASVYERSVESRAEKNRHDLELVTSLVENSGEGIIVADANGEILIFNAEAQLQHGRPYQPTSAEQWAAQYGLERADGKPLPLAETPLWQALHGRRVNGAQWFVRRPDGSLRTLEGTATPIRRADGSPGGAMIVTRDITDRNDERRVLAAALQGEEKARAEAERSLALFESILETAPVGLSFLDRDLRYVRINERLARLNGVPIEQTVGRLQREVVPDVAGHLEAVHRRVLDSGEAVVGVEVTAATPASDERRHFEASVFPVFDGAGVPWMVGTVVRETTEEKRLQAEQMALRERVLRAEAMAERAQTEANERRFRSLAEATSDIVWQTDANGQIQVDSPSWRAFTGQSREVFLANEGWEALHPDDRERVRNVWQQAVRNREQFVIEYRVRRHDGVYVPMSVRGAPVFDDDGEVVEWIGANIDISERIAHEAERQRLLESEQRARAEAEAARQRMALLDRITARLVGETRGADQVMQTLSEMLVETMGQWCAVHVPQPDGSIRAAAVAHCDPAMAEATRAFVARHPIDPNLGWGVPGVLRSGKPERSQVTEELIDAYTADPEQRAELKSWNLGSYILVPLTAQGKVIGVLALTRDADHPAFNDDELAFAEEVGVRAGLSFEQARLLQEAQAARADAEAAGRARDEFLAMLGHELRNPLAPIVTALELMKRREGQDLTRERAILERQVRHMTRLVDDLLDVSRIARGKIELRIEPVDLGEVCQRAAETTGQLFDSKGHAREMFVDDGLRLLGDPARLEQIVVNLLTNAAKYTPPGGRVTLQARRDGGNVVIAVSDDGVGIDADLLPHVFELFVQGGQSIERAAGGLGLGLTIVRRLVAAHGGEVSVASDGAGRGSTFTVVLPLADAVPPSRPDPAPAGRFGQTTRVLVVDDNEDAAVLLAQALENFGFEVQVSHSGPAAIEMVRAWRPDSLLLDIGLPGMDGYELAGRVRSEFGAAAPQMVAVTGYGQPSDRERALAAGFVEHMVKPVDLEQLRDLLAGRTETA